MKLGTSYPLLSPGDLGQTRDLAQQLDDAGFDYVVLAGHVLGRPKEVYEGRPPFTYTGPFYDPFVLFTYLATQTKRLEFITGILILPLFPTVLVAKQAAETSFFTDGRFGLGVSVSWQETEYVAMGQNVRNRGKRLEEQIEVLRLLWSKPYVTFKGKYHDLDNIGLARVPAYPIPLWVGGGSLDDSLLKRAATFGDGWMPMQDPTDGVPRLRQYLQEAGRDVSSFKIMGRVNGGPEGPDAWVAEAKRLQALGVTHLTLGAPGDLSPAEGHKRLVELRQTLSQALG